MMTEGLVVLVSEWEAHIEGCEFCREFNTPSFGPKTMVLRPCSDGKLILDSMRVLLDNGGWTR